MNGERRGGTLLDLSIIAALLLAFAAVVLTVQGSGELHKSQTRCWLLRPAVRSITKLTPTSKKRGRPSESEEKAVTALPSTQLDRHDALNIEEGFGVSTLSISHHGSSPSLSSAVKSSEANQSRVGSSAKPAPITIDSASSTSEFDEDDIYPMHGGADSGMSSAESSDPAKPRSVSDSEEELLRYTTPTGLPKYMYVLVRVDGKESKAWDCYNLLGAFRTLDEAHSYTQKEKDALEKLYGKDVHGRSQFLIRQVPVYDDMNLAPNAYEMEAAGRRAPYW